MEGFFYLTFIYWSKSYLDLKQEYVKNKEVLDRKHWHATEATLLHEGFLAIATVLTFGKSAYYCLQSARLGPLQVSLGKMAAQIVNFLCVCLLINLAFAIPFTRLYAYYDGMKQTDANGDTRSQLSSFSTFYNSFWTLFWGMFALAPVESTDIVIENLTEDKKNPVINEHGFTEGVGLILFAFFELMMMIAMINTLIAILFNTYEKIIDNADVEFKFNRTKLWMYFFDRSTMLPSPFNLLPTIAGLQSCGTFFQVLTKKVPGAKVKLSLRRCFYIEYKDKESAFDSTEYSSLMSNLVQRYFCAEDQEIQE